MRLRSELQSIAALPVKRKEKKMDLLCSAIDLQNMLLVAQQASDFLERLGAHLIANGDEGQGGNCTIQMHKLRNALALVDPPV